MLVKGARDYSVSKKYVYMYMGISTDEIESQRPDEWYGIKIQM